MDTQQMISPYPDTEVFDAEDFAAPRIKIDRTTGDFVNTVTGEITSKMIAVIIRADKSRFLWPEQYKDDNLPLCYSVDGIHPLDQSPKMPYGTHLPDNTVSCFGCAASQWVGHTRPECSISYNYLLYDLETATMGTLSLSGARAKTAKALNSAYKLYGVTRSLKLTTEMKQHPSGAFYAVNFVLMDEIADWQQFGQMMVSNRDLPLTNTIETRAPEDSDVQPDDPTEYEV